MLRAVIADDEPSVIALIKNLIDPTVVSVEIVGEAGSGTEAYELVQARKPDIVITDIRMPGMTGVELMEQCAAVLPGLDFVVISGYKSFEYALHAIKSGAADYLLKPLNKDELNDVLARLDEKRRNANASAALDTMKAAYEVGAGAMRKNALADLISEDPARRAHGAERALQPGLFQLQEGFFCVAAVRLDNGGKGAAASPEVTEAVVAKLARKLKPLCFDIEWDCGGCGGFIFLHDAALFSSLSTRMRQIKDLLRDDMARYEFFNVTIAFGTSEDQLARLRVSYETACGVSAMRHDLDAGQVLAYDLLPEDYKTRRCALTAAESAKLAKACEALAIDEMKGAAAAVFERARRESKLLFPSVFIAREALALCKGKLEGAFPSFDVPPSDAARAEIDAAATGAAVECALKCYLDGAVKSIEAQKSELESKPVRLIKEYVRARFAENITLDDMARLVFLNPAYISTIFKKEVGVSFSAYLTDTRMEEAKRLLKSTSLPVAAVARAVGYADAKYFSKQFYKAVGVKPMGYRKFYS